MKKLFLLALVGAMGLSSFAAEANKSKSKKNRKAAKTERACEIKCDKPCKPKPACCKM